MHYFYQSYGLPITSEIELPGLMASQQSDSADFVQVALGKIPLELRNIANEFKPFSSFNEHELIFKLPDIANYYVADGNKIIIEALCDNWDEVLLYVYANCLSAILFQRNLIPFHVSGVFVEKDKVLLFSAPSRTGKSTTALMFKQKGYAPFTDDTAVLSIEDGKIMAQASYPMMRLWQDTINQQSLLSDESKLPIYANAEFDKYAYLFHDEFTSGKVDIKGIVFLEEDGLEIKINRLKDIKYLEKLVENIYRGQWVNGMKKGKQQFQLLSKICQSVPAFLATRPKGIPTFESFADAIEQEILIAQHV